MRRTIRKLLRFSKMSGEFKHKRPRLSHNMSEKSYFDSYADITVHEEMLADTVRTNAYRNAIFNCSPSITDKVVLDVGAGTGILSCFCAQAGARKVYAVEASNIAEQAKQVVKTNGLNDRVIVIQSLMEEVQLPEKVDVIVSEWMGYCLLYESMLSSVITARDRWLKPGGLILPNTAEMFLAPVSDDEVVIEKINFWLDMEEAYGVDMASLVPFARKSFSKDVMVKQATCENILANPQKIAKLDLDKANKEDISVVEHSYSFNSFGMADLQGFAIWFDVSFPLRKTPPTNHEQQQLEGEEGYAGLANRREIDNVGNEQGENHHDDILAYPCKRLILSTSPYKPETHWKQSLLYLKQEVPVAQDSKITGKLILKHCKENQRFLDIDLSCEVDGEQAQTQSYFMGYEMPKKENKPV